MSVLKKLAGQTAIYGISTVLTRVMNLVFTPLYTNAPAIVADDGLGMYINLYAYVSFLNVLLTFGMETTFFRFISESKDPDKTYAQAFIWVGLAAGIFLGGVALLVAPVAGMMGYAGREPLLLTVAGVVFLDALAALPLARLRHQERVTLFSTITLTNVLVTIVLNLVLIFGAGWGVEAIFAANLAASAVRLGMALWKNTPPTLRPDLAHLRPMVEYGFFIMLAGFAGIMNETLDRIMLPMRWPEGGVYDGAIQTGLAMTGIYGANYKIAMLISLATQAFRYAAEPFFFKTAQEKDSPETFARVFHYFVIASLGAFLCISSFAWEILAFDFFGLAGGYTFVGKAYWAGVKAIPVLLLAYVCSGAYINMSIWFKITKQTRFALLFTGVGAAITIAINYWGIPIYGYMACAWATLICYAVMCVLVYGVGQRYYPIPYRIRRILVYGVIFLGAWWATRQAGPSEGDWLVLGMKVLVCAGTFGGVILAERLMPVFLPETTEAG
ncbi:MAG: oligosaccharide flippase family protein [Bacteroidia bacterium]|nr:oligosaccharide flippase family protein [Bacteroidia bacterium]